MFLPKRSWEEGWYPVNQGCACGPGRWSHGLSRRRGLFPLRGVGERRDQDFLPFFPVDSSTGLYKLARCATWVGLQVTARQISL